MSGSGGPSISANAASTSFVGVSLGHFSLR
jgi:hypothetical protein